MSTPLGRNDPGHLREGDGLSYFVEASDVASFVVDKLMIVRGIEKPLPWMAFDIVKEITDLPL